MAGARQLSLIAPFANGIIKDKAAVGAAISSSWSNGQTEGQIAKLKLVKRQMYGRGKLDLLQARLLGAAVQNCVRANFGRRLTSITPTSQNLQRLGNSNTPPRSPP